MSRYLKLLLIFLLLAVTILPSLDLAQANNGTTTTSSDAQGGGEIRVYDPQTGLLNFVGFPANLRSRAVTSISAAQNVAASFAGEFGLGAGSNLSPTATLRSRGGTYYRYQQHYQGIPVLGGELIVNTDLQGRLAAISGELSHDLSIPTAPVVSSANASQIAIAYIARGEGVNPGILRASAPKLWIYDASLVTPYQEPPMLVWRMTVYADAQPIRYDVLVSARLGGVMLAIDEIHTFLNDAQQAEAEAYLAANPQRRTDNIVGPGLPPASPNLPNYNATARTYDSNNTADQAGTGSSTLKCTTVQPGTPDQLTGADSCTNGALFDADAAHYFALETHDMFDAYFGRDSIDDNGMDLISNVRYTPGGAYGNAFWDGTQMTYGNDGFWAADDVVGHELGHGITEFSDEGLLYYYESGAINEALSDIFGEFFDQWNGIDSSGNPDAAGDRWLVGEDLDIGAIRNMSNPPEMGDPDRMRSPDYFDPTDSSWAEGTNDRGGVHTNSGVANKAAYLMVDGGSFNSYTITPLGSNSFESYELAIYLWYEVEYLLPTGADYGQLYGALNTACSNLIGVNLPGTSATLTASDCNEVMKVTLATEMHLEPAYDGYSPEAALECPVGQNFAQLYFKDFEANTDGFAFSASPAPAEYERLDGEYAREGSGSLWLADSHDTNGKLNIATMTDDIELTGATSYYMYFWHSFGFSNTNLFGGTNAYDGAVLEYSTDGGSNWNDAGSLIDDGLGYNGVIASGYENPLQARDAFVYDSHGFVSTRLNLTSLAGSNIRFRWAVGTDNWSFLPGFPIFMGVDLGWIMDNIEIYRCGELVATATDTPVTPTETPITPSATPVTPTETPVTPSATPVTPSETPVTPTETPVTPSETPVTPSATPVTPSETPVTPTETPVTPSATPVTPSETPVTPSATPVTPSATPVTPSATPVTPTSTPMGALTVSAACSGPDLQVTITSGDGPFNITASAGINMPVGGVGLGTTTILGPEKWDNVTVSETTGNLQSINLGQFKCYPNGRPIQSSPEHRAILSNPFPTFTYLPFPDASNYRVWVFDDPDLSLRTIDIRENSGGALSMQLSQPLDPGRYFWRLRARVNRIWSRWSTRWMFRIDTTAAANEVPNGMLRLEVDSPAVQQSGTWQTRQTTLASGGSYIYSGGGAADALNLTVVGDSFGLAYIQHPALGTLVVEIDGQVVRMIRTTGEERFGVVEMFEGLGTGNHSVRLYSPDGVVGVDAFFVMGFDMMAPSLPTPVPTLAPPVEPTVVPPTAESPGEPAPTSAAPPAGDATNTPLPPPNQR